jgi:hypothetical protein
MKRVLTPIGDPVILVDLDAVVMAAAETSDGRDRTVFRLDGGASTPFWIDVPFDEFKALLDNPADPKRRHGKLLAVLGEKLKHIDPAVIGDIALAILRIL